MWGLKVGRKVLRRIATIEAVEAMVHLINTPGHFHALTGKRRGEYSLDVSERDRLILRPGDEPLPIAKDGGVDLGQVRVAVLIEVTDYHAG